MPKFEYIRGLYRSAADGIDAMDEPYRTKAQRWFGIGKAAIAIGTLDVIGLSVANAALGFDPSQATLQHELTRAEVEVFGSSLLLGVLAVAGIAVAEHEWKENKRA